MKNIELLEENLVCINIDSDPLTFNPSKVSDYISVMINQAMFENLFIMDEKEYIPIPGAIERYEILEEGTLYRFFINSTKQWSNGDKLTAYDFELSFKQLLNPKLNFFAGTLAYDILNAEEIHTGELECMDSLGVSAISENVLEIKLNYPVSDFLEILTCPNFAPIPAKIFEKYGENWCELKNIISNGPFTLKNYHKNNFILLEKNPFYCNSNLKKIEGLKFLINNDYKTQMELYMSNKIQITCNTLFKYDEIKKYKHKSDFIMEPLALNSFICFNFNNKYLKNEIFRKALFLAIDREYICSLFNNGIDISYDFIPKGIKDFNYTNYKSYNLKKSKELLKSLDFYDEIKSYVFELKYTDFYPNKDILEHICHMWKKNININIKLKKITMEDLVNNINNNNFEMIYSLKVPNFNSPLSCFESFIYPHAYEKSIDFDEYINILNESLGDINLQNKIELYTKANNNLIEHLPLIPLFNFNSIYFKKNYILDFYILPFGLFSFRNLDFKKIQEE
ncbi:MAG: peptide ABC transporter substrate-binding protein [Paraclostridium sp.]